MKLSLATALVLALTACGSKTPTTTEPTGGSGEGSAASKSFDDLDHEGRIALMKHHVVPEMGAEMTAFDPKRWPKVECKTCHGKSAEDGTFKMPNPDLPKLQGAWFGPNPPEDKKEILEFMETKMKPHMGQILGLQLMDPQAPEKGGFGCLACHTM